MEAHRLETTIEEDGTVTVRGLPFQKGEAVEVIVLRSGQKRERNVRYPLRGEPAKYQDPFDSVAEDDWNALK